MGDMRRTAVTRIDEGRERRIARAVTARRRLDGSPSAARRDPEPRTGGRAWLNGTELGGTDPRHAALALSHD